MFASSTDDVVSALKRPLEAEVDIDHCKSACNLRTMYDRHETCRSTEHCLETGQYINWWHPFPPATWQWWVKKSRETHKWSEIRGECQQTTALTGRRGLAVEYRNILIISFVNGSLGSSQIFFNISKTKRLAKDINRPQKNSQSAVRNTTTRYLQKHCLGLKIALSIEIFFCASGNPCGKATNIGIATRNSQISM